MQVADPDPDPRHLVHVGGPDSPSGRTNLLGSTLLVRHVEQLVVREHQVGAAADKEVVLESDVQSLQLIHLLDQLTRDQ